MLCKVEFDFFLRAMILNMQQYTKVLGKAMVNWFSMVAFTIY